MKCKYLFFNIAMTFSFGENNKKPPVTNGDDLKNKTEKGVK